MSRRPIAMLLLLTTTTTLAAPLADYAGAGKSQGAGDATGEAKRLGRLKGLDDGKQIGYQKGLDLCAAEMKRDTVRRGQRQGDFEGGARGRHEGASQGGIDGQTKGAADGALDGDHRADRQANQDASPKGIQDGTTIANQSDAAARGAVDGKIAGNSAAKSAAETNEYERAREAYRAERKAEAIRSENTIRIGGAPLTTTLTQFATASMASLSSIFKTNESAVSDPTLPDAKPEKAAEQTLAYCKANASTTAEPNPGTGTPAPKSDFEKCTDDYRPAYEAAFIATFKSEYVLSYTTAYDQQYTQWNAEGCKVARASDYSRDYEAAYRRSYDESYRTVFNDLYNQIYHQVYPETFATASAAAFSDRYDSHYREHYEAAKAKATSDRTGEIYNSAHASAKDAEFRAKYPGYAAAVISRGRADEAAEFTRLPVRLLGLKVIESVKDGILEAGEKLTVDLDLRNFSDSVIASREIDIRAVAKSTSGIAIPGAVALLPKDLAAKSLNHITGALDLRLDESAIGKAASLEVQISVKGQRVASESIDLTAGRLTRVELVETPVVRLGYPGTLRVRVTNLSSLPLPENATLSVSTSMEGVSFPSSSNAVNSLASGETREVSFPFSADGYSGNGAVNFTASLNLLSGRRVGLLNETRSVAGLQDYSFKIRNGLFDGDISALKKSGTTRLVIFIKNVSQRKGTESITVTASITGPNAANFKFTRGNQVVFSPLDPGCDQKQKIVVRADRKNSGGTFILDVREGGKLLGRYKEDF